MSTIIFARNTITPTPITVFAGNFNKIKFLRTTKEITIRLSSQSNKRQQFVSSIGNMVYKKKMIFHISFPDIMAMMVEAESIKDIFEIDRYFFFS